MDSQSQATNSSGGRLLAIEGGSPVRSKPMPARLAVGVAERAMIAEALDYYNAHELDPG